MIDNLGLINDLLAKHRIRMRNSEVFNISPPHLPVSFTFEKVEGMLLGLAVGDALGYPTEGKKPGDRYSKYGEIRDYISGKRGPGGAINR